MPGHGRCPTAMSPMLLEPLKVGAETRWICVGGGVRTRDLSHHRPRHCLCAIASPLNKVVASFFIIECLRKRHDWLPRNFRSTRGWPLPLFVSRFPGNLRSLASVIRPKTFLQASRGCQSSRSYCTGIREEWPLPSGAQGHRHSVQSAGPPAGGSHARSAGPRIWRPVEGARERRSRDEGIGSRNTAPSRDGKCKMPFTRSSKARGMGGDGEMNFWEGFILRECEIPVALLLLCHINQNYPE